MTTTFDDRLDPALRRLIAVLLLGGLMGILSGSMVAIATDTLSRTLHASLSAVGWASTGYLLALTVTIPVTAWAVQRVGGRRLWLFGLGLFLVGSLGAGLSPNIGTLIGFRALQGIGAGIVDPLMLMLLAFAAGPSRAGRVMGVMGIVGSSGPILGPILGGIILRQWDWRWMFLVSVPVVIVAFVLSLRVLPTDLAAPQPGGFRLDAFGVALLGPGFAAGVLAMTQAAEHGTFATWQVVVPLLAGAALLAGYGRHALRRRTTPPLIDLRLFTRRSFSASVVVGAFVGVATFASIFAIPLYLEQVRGYDVLESGLLLAPLGVGAAIAMPITGRFSDRVGSRELAFAGSVVTVASAVGFSLLGADTSRLWIIVAGFFIGVGMGATGAPTQGSLYRTLPPEQVPQGSSVLYMLNQLGGSFGVAVAALLIQTAATPLAGFHHAYYCIVAILAIGLAATVFLPGKAVAAPAASAAPIDGAPAPVSQEA
ncbi:DHA2 family efflux MFS transporter permease subunit [Nocardia stercoris]|uniref:DHA2 family efflux MFS transporter permease subunit n=1 Tax=Nocardia stercoris TaxID=2483361 RepID=A0A3M2L0D6_9NOCA|nr:DHA2 family efflux MFS transporter permease subunit [Nocardia stercoris]RMI31189.1 DHA2 family efflux MFS transporter permease subunit [Nocardia stercoris]